MKGLITLKILEAIEATARGMGDFMNIFLTDYHTSYRLARGLSRRGTARRRDYDDLDEEEKHRFSDLLAKLKKDGLIAKNNTGSWHITKKGRMKKKQLLLRQKRGLSTLVPYSAQESPEWKIVIFDVPETERRKRVWLRLTLKRLGFKKLQKSVFIGKVGLPEGFLNDLRRLQLITCVEIFAITKAGSLRQIT